MNLENEFFLIFETKGSIIIIGPWANPTVSTQTVVNIFQNNVGMKTKTVRKFKYYNKTKT